MNIFEYGSNKSSLLLVYSYDFSYSYDCFSVTSGMIYETVTWSKFWNTGSIFQNKLQNFGTLLSQMLVQ